MFKKGDILVGTKRGFKEAYHPLVFLAGSDEVPIAVILTHSGNFPCNIKMSSNHFIFELNDETTYFIAHVIEKLPNWGPYKKIGELSTKGISFIEKNLSLTGLMTWEEYLKFKGKSCPFHC